MIQRSEGQQETRETSCSSVTSRVQEFKNCSPNVSTLTRSWDRCGEDSPELFFSCTVQPLCSIVFSIFKMTFRQKIYSSLWIEVVWIWNCQKKKKKFRAARVPELLEKHTQNPRFQFHISGAAGRGNRCTLVLSQRRVIFMKPSGGAAQTVTHV